MALLAGALLVATGVSAQIVLVPVRPPQPQAGKEQWVVGKAQPGTCIDAGQIAGAVVIDPATIELVMRGGKRWLLKLRNACPQLSYYGGFYYSQGQAGKICAGRDRIIGRAGGACEVAKLLPLVKASKRKPR